MNLNEMILQTLVARKLRANWRTPIHRNLYCVLSDNQFHWLDTVGEISEVGHLQVALDGDERAKCFDPWDEIEREDAISYTEEICNLYSVGEEQ